MRIERVGVEESIPIDVISRVDYVYFIENFVFSVIVIYDICDSSPNPGRIKIYTSGVLGKRKCGRSYVLQYHYSYEVNSLARYLTNL